MVLRDLSTSFTVLAGRTSLPLASSHLHWGNRLEHVYPIHIERFLLLTWLGNSCFLWKIEILQPCYHVVWNQVWGKSICFAVKSNNIHNCFVFPSRNVDLQLLMFTLTLIIFKELSPARGFHSDFVCMFIWSPVLLPCLIFINNLSSQLNRSSFCFWEPLHLTRTLAIVLTVKPTVKCLITKDWLFPNS